MGIIINNSELTTTLLRHTLCISGGGMPHAFLPLGVHRMVHRPGLAVLTSVQRSRRLFQSSLSYWTCNGELCLQFFCAALCASVVKASATCLPPLWGAQDVASPRACSRQSVQKSRRV